MRSRLVGVVAAALLIGSTAVSAGVILQDTYNASIQVQFFEPIAQSFTAEDTSVSFAFYYRTFNPGFANDPLELRLLSGNGLGGAQLGSFGFSIASGFDGYFDVDVSSVALTVGQVYTAVLSVPGTSPYWGVDLNNDGNPYSGGRAYFTDRGSVATPDALDDFRFRVTPTSVPEPGTLALLGLGLAGLAATRRRK